jgi:hypothetical protein
VVYLAPPRAAPDAASGAGAGAGGTAVMVVATGRVSGAPGQVSACDADGREGLCTCGADGRACVRPVCVRLGLADRCRGPAVAARGSRRSLDVLSMSRAAVPRRVSLPRAGSSPVHRCPGLGLEWRGRGGAVWRRWKEAGHMGVSPAEGLTRAPSRAHPHARTQAPPRPGSHACTQALRLGARAGWAICGCLRRIARWSLSLL